MSCRVLASMIVLPLLVLAACGDDETTEPVPPAETSAPTDPPSSVDEPVPVDTAPVDTAPVDTAPVDTAPVDEPVPVEAVYEEVAFYPACGDEVLQHEGIAWYQVHEADHPEAWAAVFDVERAEPHAPTGFRNTVRVAPPGPGDDVGTLVVWADGVARFVSDSGDLTAWMVDDELTYEWVC